MNCFTLVKLPRSLGCSARRTLSPPLASSHSARATCAFLPNCLCCNTRANLSRWLDNRRDRTSPSTIRSYPEGLWTWEHPLVAMIASYNIYILLSSRLVCLSSGCVRMVESNQPRNKFTVWIETSISKNESAFRIISYYTITGWQWGATKGNCRGRAPAQLNLDLVILNQLFPRCASYSTQGWALIKCKCLIESQLLSLVLMGLDFLRFSPQHAHNHVPWISLRCI